MSCTHMEAQEQQQRLRVARLTGMWKGAMAPHRDLM